MQMTTYQDFGSYLRYLRENHNPMITQEKLGELVGKKKMTISLIENGKNAPPKDEFLQKLVEVLNLDESQRIKLFDLAAIARGAVPEDIVDYFNEHQGLRNAIRKAKRKKLPNSFWEKITKEEIDVQ